MPLADSYPLLNIFWTMLLFFCFFIWIWILFTVFADLFRRHDISGWGKTGWIIFVIILPFLGVFVYLIAEHQGMTDRTLEAQQQAKAATDSYVRSVAGGSADQIAKAKELLDTGAITQAEFDQIKRQALSA